MRRFLVLVLLLAAACARPPVQDELTIEFPADNESVVVTAETRFEMNPRTPEIRKRVEAARDAAINGTDGWSVRFARLHAPDVEQVTRERRRGELEIVTRTVRVHPDDLHRIFADTAVTIRVVRHPANGELAFYPGTSSRATREQQRRFEEDMTSWSTDVANYFRAVRHLYAYLDLQPGRAEAVFGALFTRDEDGPEMSEEEEPLVEDVVDAMLKIAQRLEQQNTHAQSLAEMADLVFNPFPARIVVRVPSKVFSADGFTRAGNDFVIEPVDLMKALGELEGRWISPDPLAALLRDEEPSAEEIAKKPRQAASSVSAGEITAAVREQIARPRSYLISWAD